MTKVLNISISQKFLHDPTLTLGNYLEVFSFCKYFYSMM